MLHVGVLRAIPYIEAKNRATALAGEVTVVRKYL